MSWPYLYGQYLDLLIQSFLYLSFPETFFPTVIHCFFFSCPPALPGNIGCVLQWLLELEVYTLYFVGDLWSLGQVFHPEVPTPCIRFSYDSKLHVRERWTSTYLWMTTHEPVWMWRIVRMTKYQFFYVSFSTPFLRDKVATKTWFSFLLFKW